MNFSSDSTPEQAARYLRYIAAHEPYKLQFLARLMAQSGGPIEEMDASFTSVNALWAWTVEYVTAGFPGALEHYARLREQAGEGGKEWESDPEWIAITVGGGVEYYLRLIWERYSPPASWQLYESASGARHRDHHSVGVDVDGAWTDVDYAPLVWEVLEGHPYARKADALSRKLLLAQGWSEFPAMASGPSVLAPFVDAQLGPMPADGQISMKALRAEVPAGDEPVMASAVGEPVTLWRGPFDALDEPSLAGALDAERVARVLANLGFVDGDGGRPTASALRAASGDGIELCVPTMDAFAAVVASEGEVRLVHVEPVEISRWRWRRMRAALKKVARAERARLVADSHME